MTQTRNSIVCGVDGSAAGAAATRVAAELASDLDAQLTLVHAVDDPPPFPYGDARERELQRGRSVRAGTRLLDAAAAGLDAQLTVRLGDPVDALEAVCREESAALLVVGSRGRSGLAAALLGSVSVRLAGKGMCPVVIVPPGAGQRFHARARSGSAIVCGVDGSAESERAVSVAVGLGERMGLEPLPVFVNPALTWTTPPQAPRRS